MSNNLETQRLNPSFTGTDFLSVHPGIGTKKVPGVLILLLLELTF